MSDLALFNGVSNDETDKHNEENEIVISEGELTTLKTAGEVLQDIKSRSNRAVSALSVIRKIETDDDDKKAEDLLVKVRSTYDLIKNNRMGVTSVLDGIKSALMEPEKRISTDANAQNSEYNRVRGLRNGYAQLKLTREKEAAAAAQRALDKANEITRMKGLFEQAYINIVSNAILALENSIAAYKTGITLDNFEEKEKRFSITPKLRETSYYEMFAVIYDRNLLPDNEADALINEMQAILTYDKVNHEYIAKAAPIVTAANDSLPALKAQLTEMAELEITNKAEADRLKTQKEANDLKEKQDREAAAAAEQSAAAQKIEAAQGREMLTNTFTAQVATQSAAANLTGVVKRQVATIDCPPADIVEVLAKMLFEIYSNPVFKGHIKAKSGKLQYDEAGRPVYADWLEELLTIYAFHHDPKLPPVPGIVLTEKAITSARAKKA